MRKLAVPSGLAWSSLMAAVLWTLHWSRKPNIVVIETGETSEGRQLQITLSDLGEDHEPSYERWTWVVWVAEDEDETSGPAVSGKEATQVEAWHEGIVAASAYVSGNEDWPIQLSVLAA